MRTVLVAVSVLLCFAAVAAAQNNGRITGLVTDPAGAAVPGASIRIVNEATRLEWSATTNDRGDFVVITLPPGAYAVRAEASGFKRMSRSGLELVADGRLTANFTLEIGDVSSSVEVAATIGEAVNTVSGELSRTVDSNQLQDLALDGRNYLQLVSLVPGAALLNDDQLALTTSLSSTGQAINGNRPNSSNLMVDGAFNLDAGANGSQINNVGVDFIREVQVKTSNFSAEYGRQSGAAVNVVTRSGGSKFHGGAFEFLRNDKLDARSFFAPQKPSLRFNNFGWNLGGPVPLAKFKHKLFFFAGEEWKYIRRYTDATLRTLPTRAERRGDFSARTGTLNLPGTTTPVPGRNLTSLVTPDGKAIAAVYDRMEQLAVRYTDTVTSNNAIYQAGNPFQVRQDIVRLDYRLNDRHSIYGRYMHDAYDLIDAFGSFVVSQLPTVPTNRVRPATSWQLGHTWMIAPNLINEARANAGWHSQRAFLSSQDWVREKYGFVYPELFQGGGRYPTGIPDVSINGVSSFSGPTYYVSTTTDISFSEALTWIKSDHTVKFGFLATRNRKDANGRPPLTGSLTFNPSGNGNTTGNAMADALLGNFRTYTEAQYDPIGMFRFSQYDAYVTDQWKLTRRFSIEYGVRYQSLLPVTTDANNVANFVPSLYDPKRAVTVLRDGTLVAGAGNIFNGLIRAGDGVPKEQLGRVPDGNNPLVLSVPAGAPRGLHKGANPLAPRFSFAWSPSKDNRTAVRGGFGMFYDRIDQTAIVQGGLVMPPFGERIQLENGNLKDPTSGKPSARGVIATIRPIDANLKWPNTMNYSLGIQREVGAGVFVEASYVGNQSRHQMRQPDINQPPFALLVTNSRLPAAQQSVTNALRPYLGYSSILMRLSDANANYSGLQLYATKRKGWFTWTASYTWSKALAESSSNTEAGDTNPDRHYNYGPASFDRRHVFVSTFNAKLPLLKGHAGWQRQTIGGWELSGITRYQTGQYYTITASTSIGTRRASYNGQTVKLDNPTVAKYFNTAAFTAAPLDQYGNAGAGTVGSPGLRLWDFSLRKQFTLTEQVKLRFQADFFNAFNKANLRGMGTVVTNANFGSLTASGPGRDIQFGLKLNF
jgi:hypothetical protein